MPEEYFSPSDIQLWLCSCREDVINHSSALLSLSGKVLRFVIFIVVEREHVEICKLPSMPALLEIIVPRPPVGKLLLLPALSGRKEPDEEKRNMEKQSGSSVG